MREQALLQRAESASRRRPSLRYSSATATKRREPGSRSSRRSRSRMRASAVCSATVLQGRRPPKGAAFVSRYGVGVGRRTTHGRWYWKAPAAVTDARRRPVRDDDVDRSRRPAGCRRAFAPVQVGAAVVVVGIVTTIAAKLVRRDEGRLAAELDLDLGRIAAGSSHRRSSGIRRIRRRGARRTGPDEFDGSRRRSPASATTYVNEPPVVRRSGVEVRDLDRAGRCRRSRRSGPAPG